MRKILKVFVAGAVSAAFLAVAQGPALAYCQVSCAPAQQPERWNQGHAVGACGITQGNYAKSMQAILWVNGNFSSSASIDGVFGSASTAALKTYQGEHGLSQDGCAGYGTWTKAQDGSHRVREPDGYYVTYNHMRNVGTGYDAYGYLYYKYDHREDWKRNGRGVRYNYNPGYDCWDFLRGDGSRVVVSTIGNYCVGSAGG